MLRDPQDDLTALLGSRICHDLISPLGAISNGLELMEMSGQGGSPEVSLIADSITNANARIRFFRIAFGLAAEGAVLDRSEIASVIDDTFRGSRLSVVWEPLGALPRAEVKLAFLALMCLESAMPFGGEIVVRCNQSDWALVATSEKLRDDRAHWTALTDRAAPMDLTPANVHFGLLRQLTAEHDQPLQLSVEDGRITIAF